jgi:hypothetical protein
MTGVKHDAGKAPMHLLPPRPLIEIAEVFDFGQAKYSAFNWTGGFPVSRLFSAMLRHLWSWWAGEDNDPESGKSHLAHAGCCLLMAMDLMRSRRGGFEDDRPKGLVASAFELEAP